MENLFTHRNVSFSKALKNNYRRTDEQNCYFNTFGHDMDKAYDSAIDVLAGWLELADDEYIPEKNLTFEEVREQFPDREIMKIPVDTSIMKKYKEKQRFNASFPKSVLERVDTFAKEKGWNRAQFLIRASEKLISENSI